MAILLVFLGNLHSCFCARKVDECYSTIARVSTKMQEDLATGSLNYEILSDFSVRCEHRDYDGCLLIIKMCLSNEITQICHDPDTIRLRVKPSEDDQPLLDSLSALESNPYGKRVWEIIGRVNWDNLGLPQKPFLPPLMLRIQQHPGYSEPELRTMIEHALLQRLLEVIG